MLSAKLIKSTALELGADTVGIAFAGPVAVKDKYLKWLENGYAGEMTYLARNIEERFNPERLLPGARSIIVVGFNYFPPGNDRLNDKTIFKVARYAWGEDYHNVIRRMLERLQSGLKKIEPALSGRICVDTSAFMEKYWAQKAGLGWQGKHTILVSRQFGCWLLLGGLIIDCETDEYDQPQTDHCGTCTACLDVCPTRAFPDAYVLEATRCLSYWTIESKAETFPRHIEKNIDRRVYGCDTCLGACPFNRFEKPLREPSFGRRDCIDLLESGDAANLTAADFKKHFETSAVYRPGLNRIRRNINAARRRDIA